MMQSGADGQLSIFDIDVTKEQLYNVLKINKCKYIIQNYYLYKDYHGLVKYFYIRTADNIIIDLCLSDFPEVFAVYEGFTDKQIKQIYRGRL
ncbi:hypothetical protein M3Y14_34435 (plasmid) [Bacillus thuringiensis]|uniref:hypothetical protein n=1 Tax=Bacillus thuringiensis TaxID=1428 RepID=UPI00222461C2|nr:hypothetical protein [Bacillus thuringiensis]UYX56082.1 hypothetical protein M3Y14_34435 [Bacillus thuringiensis]